MKLIRYGNPEEERPGLIDESGKLRSISDVVDDISSKTIGAGLIDALRSIDSSKLPIVEGRPRIGPCIADAGNFVAVGMNYADHARESGVPIPAEPVLFNKARSCIVGPYDDVKLPPLSKKTDWEAELGFIVGKRASYITEAQAIHHIAGYCVCNDVTEREYVLDRGGQWMKGKCCPTFGPLGPWLVTPDEIPDPQNLSIWLELNGRRVQNGSTSTMIFTVAHVMSYISQFMILEPGDIVITGTPPGVGLGMKPPVFLKPGDVMRLGITGLGVQEQRVIE